MYVWDFSCEKCSDVLIDWAKTITIEFDNELSNQDCKVLERRDFGTLEDHKNNETAISGTDLTPEQKTKLASVKAKAVVLGNLWKGEMDSEVHINIRIIDLSSANRKSIIIDIPSEEMGVTKKRREYLRQGILEMLGKKPQTTEKPTQSTAPANQTAYSIANAKPGDCVWFRHDDRNSGGPAWTGPKKVGDGWNAFDKVFAAPNGILYAIQPNGDLMWAKHTGRANGDYAWAGNFKKVGSGWNEVTMVTAAADGVVYAVKPNGDLLWFKHTDQENGGPTWIGPKKVGDGWNIASKIFAAPDGILYYIKPNGELICCRHTGWKTGEYTWADNGKKVGDGWNAFAHVFSTGTDGVIYGVNRDGSMMWAKHTGRANGDYAWAGNFKKVGSDWNKCLFVFGAGTEGYIYGVMR